MVKNSSIGSIRLMKRVLNPNLQMPNGSVLGCKFSIKDIVDLSKKYNIDVYKAIKLDSNSCTYINSNNSVGATQVVSTCRVKGGIATVTSGGTCPQPTKCDPCTGHCGQIDLCVTVA